MSICNKLHSNQLSFPTGIGPCRLRAALHDSPLNDVCRMNGVHVGRSADRKRAASDAVPAVARRMEILTPGLLDVTFWHSALTMHGLSASKHGTRRATPSGTQPRLQTLRTARTHARRHDYTTSAPLSVLDFA